VIKKKKKELIFFKRGSKPLFQVCLSSRVSLIGNEPCLMKQMSLVRISLPLPLCRHAKKKKKNVCLTSPHKRMRMGTYQVCLFVLNDKYIGAIFKKFLIYKKACGGHRQRGSAIANEIMTSGRQI
jgi:hypothetical protein